MDRQQRTAEANGALARDSFQTLRRESAATLKARRIALKPQYGITVEQFLETKRAQAEERERIAGRAVRTWAEISHDALRRPMADYGGTY